MTQRRAADKATQTSPQAPGHQAGPSPRAGVSVRDALVAGGLRGFGAQDILDGRSERLALEAEVVPLHDFSQTGAPVTAWQVRIQGERVAPRLVGRRRTVRAEAEADLAALVGAA